MDSIRVKFKLDSLEDADFIHKMEIIRKKKAKIKVMLLYLIEELNDIENEKAKRFEPIQSRCKIDRDEITKNNKTVRYLYESKEVEITKIIPSCQSRNSKKNNISYEFEEMI